MLRSDSSSGSSSDSAGCALRHIFTLVAKLTREIITSNDKPRIVANARLIM
jgi:hypothetical protein